LRSKLRFFSEIDSKSRTDNKDARLLADSRRTDMRPC